MEPLVPTYVMLYEIFSLHLMIILEKIMTIQFKRSFIARWSDIDFNAHIRSSAYLDIASDVRLMFFNENGFSLKEFKKLNIAPIHLKDEIIYFNEIKMLENIEVILNLSGLSEDGSRFCFKNFIYRKDGKIAAHVISTGAWLNIKTRHIYRPPDSLYNLLDQLEKCDNFKNIEKNMNK